MKQFKGQFIGHTSTSSYQEFLMPGIKKKDGTGQLSRKMCLELKRKEMNTQCFYKAI